MDNTSQNQQAKRITIPYVQGVAEKIGRILRKKGETNSVQACTHAQSSLTSPLVFTNQKQDCLYKVKIFPVESNILTGN